jgi:hypothetical protein
MRKRIRPDAIRDLRQITAYIALLLRQAVSTFFMEWGDRPL